ncbi:hypothetical protein [Lacticaseibacillus saniviri]|uniref:hypothetical protein n=1 Tax=Lacticaseibacillus saniviri TaxID=931533 RepID=UPI0006CFB281|nr:hypothetical protein [Lacticaseibacillus saniviri]
MITDQQEQQWIEQLIASDKATSTKLDKQTKEALIYISSHLLPFYTHYATDEGISVSQVMQKVSKWDIQQWQAAIDELKEDGWLPEEDARVTAMGKLAGVSVGMMMSAIASLAVLKMTRENLKVAQARINSDRDAEFDRMNALFDKKITRDELPPAINLMNDVWLTGDRTIMTISGELVKRLSGFNSTEEFQDFLSSQTSSGSSRKKSMSDLLLSQTATIAMIVRTQSAKMKFEINMLAYRKNDVEW